MSKLFTVLNIRLMVHRLGFIKKLGCYSDNIVVLKIEKFGCIIFSSDIDFTICEAHMNNMWIIRLFSDSKDLKYEGTIKSDTDVYNSILSER